MVVGGNSMLVGFVDRLNFEFNNLVNFRNNFFFADEIANDDYFPLTHSARTTKRKSPHCQQRLRDASVLG